MYAECLETGVGQQGLPVFACEDQKDYATCKYVVGEIFKVVSFTAVFDHYLEILRGTLRNPFKLLGIAPGYLCMTTAKSPDPFSYPVCAGAKIINFIGSTASELASIVDAEFFKIQNNYCDEFDDRDDEDDKDDDDNREDSNLLRRN
jgi:hypothetical protein